MKPFLKGEAGASNDPCSDIYHGSSPFSESETAAVRDFLLKHKSNLRFFNDVHSALNMVLLPWGYQSQHTPDYDEQMAFFKRAANALRGVHGEVYKVGAIPDLLYVASGSTVDYAYGTLGIKYSTAIELRGKHGFAAPPNTIILECQEMWAFHQQAGRDIIAEYVAPIVSPIVTRAEWGARPPKMTADSMAASKVLTIEDFFY